MLTQVPIAIVTIGTVPKQLKFQMGVKLIYNKLKIRLLKLCYIKLRHIENHIIKGYNIHHKYT